MGNFSFLALCWSACLLSIAVLRTFFPCFFCTVSIYSKNKHNRMVCGLLTINSRYLWYILVWFTGRKRADGESESSIITVMLLEIYQQSL